MDETREDPLEQTRMSLGEHLEELRGCLLRALAGLAVGVVLSLVFASWLIAQIKRPYDLAAAAAGVEADLTVIDITAGFMTYMRVGLIGGLILTSPWVFYQLWMFVAAGLYPHERRAVLASAPFSALLFVAGALTFLFGLAQPTLLFFFTFNRWLGLEANITLENHVAFMTGLMLVFGLAFQLPIVMYILARVGLVSAARFGRYRRHAVVIILIVAALVTSPSPIDQVGLAVPMYLLYELGIQLARLAQRKRQAAATDEPARKDG